MNTINTKRIIKDINDLEQHNLNSHGIYHTLYEDNIYNLKILMIGSSNTPYENGYYFFDIKLPTDYPFKPPLVKYCTQNNKTRFNPNLYTSGKVCLSILNTWNGPQWSSCNSLTSVLLSIQAIVFVENPLHNEPGFEKELGIKNKNYNELILYENFRTAIYGMLNNIPKTFEYFNSIIIKNFIDNYDKINKNLDNNLHKNENEIEFSLYRMKEKLYYSDLKILINNLYENILHLNS
jgi:ubiquitin-conjugating enzyme E2 Z